MGETETILRRQSKPVPLLPEYLAPQPQFVPPAREGEITITDKGDTVRTDVTLPLFKNRWNFLLFSEQVKWDRSVFQTPYPFMQEIGGGLAYKFDNGITLSTFTSMQQFVSYDMESFTTKSAPYIGGGITFTGDSVTKFFSDLFGID